MSSNSGIQQSGAADDGSEPIIAFANSLNIKSTRLPLAAMAMNKFTTGAHEAAREIAAGGFTEAEAMEIVRQGMALALKGLMLRARDT